MRAFCSAAAKCGLSEVCAAPFDTLSLGIHRMKKKTKICLAVAFGGVILATDSCTEQSEYQEQDGQVIYGSRINDYIAELCQDAGEENCPLVKIEFTEKSYADLIWTDTAGKIREKFEDLLNGKPIVIGPGLSLQTDRPSAPGDSKLNPCAPEIRVCKEDDANTSTDPNSPKTKICTCSCVNAHQATKSNC